MDISTIKFTRIRTHKNRNSKYEKSVKLKCDTCEREYDNDHLTLSYPGSRNPILPGGGLRKPPG